jgi:hypothetical protein
VGIGLVFDEEIDNRKELGLPLVARAIRDDNVTYFKERPQRCFAFLLRPRQNLPNHRRNECNAFQLASRHEKPPGVVSRHIVERIARKGGAGGQDVIENR